MDSGLNDFYHIDGIVRNGGVHYRDKAKRDEHPEGDGRQLRQPYIYLLSRGFLIVLSISALIALPLTYLFFENFVLTNFELVVGLLAVLLIALIMIASQTMKAARSNPAEVLKTE